MASALTTCNLWIFNFLNSSKNNDRHECSEKLSLMLGCVFLGLCMVRRMGGDWHGASACHYTPTPSPPPTCVFLESPNLVVRKTTWLICKGNFLFLISLTSLFQYIQSKSWQIDIALKTSQFVDHKPHGRQHVFFWLQFDQIV